MKNMIFVDFDSAHGAILNNWHQTEKESGQDKFEKFIVPSGVLLGDYISFVDENIDELQCKVALLDNQVVGFVCYIQNNDSLFVECMGVNPATRGQGISSEILSMLKSTASSLGLKRVTLNVHKNNSSGIRAFAKVGRQIESTSPHYLDFEIQ